MGGLLKKVSTNQWLRRFIAEGFFKGVFLESGSDFTFFIDWLIKVYREWEGDLESFFDLIDKDFITCSTPLLLSPVFNEYVGFQDANNTICYMNFMHSCSAGYMFSISKCTKSEEIVRTYQLTRSGKIIPKTMVINYSSVKNELPEYSLKYTYSEKEHRTTLTVSFHSYRVDIEYKTGTIDFDVSLAYKLYTIGFMEKHMYDLRPCLSRILEVFKGSDSFPVRVTTYHNYMYLGQEVSFSDILSCIELTDTHIQFYLHTKINYEKDVKEMHGYTMSVPIEQFLSQTT